MFKVSKGNSKLGNIYNINLPAITTCIPNAPCAKDCYACKGNYLFKNVKECYAENLRVYLASDEQMENDILKQLPTQKKGFCRWHSSGDIPDVKYLLIMHYIALQRPDIKFLCFTKRYNFVNSYLSGFTLPKNLKLVFSLWEGLECYNPFNVPTATVREHELYSDDAIPCGGHCEDCYICWLLGNGEQVIFNKH